jgi:membrane protease YdiL (CAAX protease family)
MRFFQTPARPWWWGLIALAAYAAASLLIVVIAGVVLAIIDPEFTNATIGGRIVTTPTVFLVNNIAIALDIVVCTALSYAFFRQGFGWLVSVVGRFRWKWAAIALGIFAAGYAIQMVVDILVEGSSSFGLNDLTLKPYTWLLIVGILVTTPFQCAGEEFQARAFLPRLIAAIIPFRWVGLVLSALVPSVVFMLMHDAQDPWLNFNYFCVALMMWWLAYRTGGIEASIALHVVNNLFSEWTMPFTDISDMFDRSVGTGSPTVLIYLAVQLALVVIVDIVARRRGIVRMSAPAAATPVVVRPRHWFTNVATATEDATAKDLPRIATTVRETVAAAFMPPAFPESVPAMAAPGFVGVPGFSQSPSSGEGSGFAETAWPDQPALTPDSRRTSQVQSGTPGANPPPQPDAPTWAAPQSQSGAPTWEPPTSAPAARWEPPQSPRATPREDQPPSQS